MNIAERTFQQAAYKGSADDVLNECRKSAVAVTEPNLGYGLAIVFWYRDRSSIVFDNRGFTIR